MSGVTTLPYWNCSCPHEHLWKLSCLISAYSINLPCCACFNTRTNFISNNSESFLA